MGRLDAEALVAALDEIDSLIRSVLDRKDKDCFETAAKLGACAHQLVMLNDPAPVMPPPSSQMEADVRTMGPGAERLLMAMGPAISNAVEAGRSQLRKARADEMEALVRVRKTMLESGAVVDDVDAAIAEIKAEIIGVEVR
jgi:hypothetical protein